MPRQARSALVALDLLEQLQMRGGDPVSVSELSREIGVGPQCVRRGPGPS